MRRFLMRAAGGALLVSALSVGAVNVFAAGAPGATPEAAGAETADTPDVLPAGAIPQTQAQQDALKSYPGGTAVFDSVNDSDGTITYGFIVTVGGKSYDVQVDALKGTVVQADANDGPDIGGADVGAADTGGANQ